ncbi:MAG: HAMP domain-containing histidine kinase [Bacteroidaceae bacterium]|nr:HAMP domain-containing histidine kinase [Bacteroidaceae bacterium]
MKKSIIWILSAVMCVSFVFLLTLQFSYIKKMTDLRHQHFDESVKRSLYEVAHKLELAEAERYLEEDIREMQDKSNYGNISIDGFYSQTFSFQNGQFSYSQTFQQPVQTPSTPGQTPSLESTTPTMPSLQVPRSQNESGSGVINERSRVLQQRQLERYLSNKELIDEVIYNMLVSTGNRTLAQRIDNTTLANELTDQLALNGIEIPFHYVLTTNTGRVIYTCCKEANTNSFLNSYSQVVFHNDNPNRMGVIRVSFPTLDDYIDKSVGFMLPSLIFIAILMVTFAFTLFVITRQRKITEMKNDFVNNMTHEFKTPISTISLAAQMLNDQAVSKSPQMFKHISGVINDETKRLRFQVEKVLQMSMFERQSNTMKLKEMDVDELINGVINTFKLKVENIGGTIDAQFETEDPFGMVDEMHFTNVIFNLMDNAVKYKRTDVPLHLEVRTWNESGKLMVSIADNGIGIKRDDLKKIFDRFYRVHTGNRHDVKGFGLGLAYVKKVIVNHKGTIKAESELGNGTKFIISLPQNNE